jgi:hypothetical protein
VIALLPAYRCLAPAFPNRVYDPRRYGLGADGSEPEDWLLVGGRSDFSSGLLRDPEAPAELVAEAAAAVRAGVGELAEELGARPLALFVGDRELDLLAGAAGPFRERRALSEEFRIESLPATFEAHVASLAKKHRYRIRSELAEQERLGIRSSRIPLRENLGPVSELIFRVKARHGIPDHPTLIAHRLEEWLDCPGTEVVTFVAETAEEVLAVSVCLRWGDSLSTYEVGLPDGEGAARHLGYLDVLVYAPLRFAIEGGCRELALGFGSELPKRLRGAGGREVWALW